MSSISVVLSILLGVILGTNLEIYSSLWTRPFKLQKELFNKQGKAGFTNMNRLGWFNFLFFLAKSKVLCLSLVNEKKIFD